jgi:hypothetical protein
MNLSLPIDTQLHNPHFHIGLCRMIRREKPKLTRMPTRTADAIERYLERYRCSTSNLRNRLACNWRSQLSSAPHGDEVFTFVDRYSSAPPSPTAIGDGKVITLTATFIHATKQFTKLSSRCERSSSNYALAGACPERVFVQS